MPWTALHPGCSVQLQPLKEMEWTPPTPDSEGGRVEVDPHGPTASKCQVGSVNASQANARRDRAGQREGTRRRGHTLCTRQFLRRPLLARSRRSQRSGPGLVRRHRRRSPLARRPVHRRARGLRAGTQLAHRAARRFLPDPRQGRGRHRQDPLRQVRSERLQRAAHLCAAHPRRGRDARRGAHPRRRGGHRPPPAQLRQG